MTASLRWHQWGHILRLASNRNIYQTFVTHLLYLSSNEACEVSDVGCYVFLLSYLKQCTEEN